MAATSTLKMVFEMYDGNHLNLSLKDPKSNLTLSNVEAFAQICTDNDALIRNNSTVLRLESAYIQRSERIELAD